jgi:large subunit ribosomal protein L11
MSGARVLVKKVKMRVPAGNATAAPPVGPTLGQAGVNLMDFCKLFNARTQKYKEGIQLPVKLLTYSDRSFEFHVSTPVRDCSRASDSANLARGAGRWRLCQALVAWPR